MSIKKAGLGWAILLVLTLVPRLGSAQSIDQLGNRASALGAFVAVADDATAVVWNPAALVNGPFFNFALDFGRSTGKDNTSLLAIGLPPLGLSYFRVRQSYTSAAATPSDREDRQVVFRSLVTTNLGVTVLQSLADGVTVGATLRLVRGSTSTGTIEGDARTTGDVDIGALAGTGRVRVGFVARNLTTPTFDGATIGRQARLGVAWADRWPATSRTILSLDADLLRVQHASGERRDIAAGAERWFRAQTLAVRGGLRASTVGDVRPVVSAGASYAVRSGLYVDGYAARGQNDDRRWGIAARLTY